MSIDSLSDDLLSEILVRVPAEDIHENVRIVCRRWKSIIRGSGFVNAHFRRCCSGLLIAWRILDGRFVYAHFHSTCSGHLIAKFSDENSYRAAAQDRIQISKLGYKLNFPVLAGCNGLILGRETESAEGNRRYVIVNPVTKRRFNLPRLVGGSDSCNFSLAYAASTGEYKVVATWCDVPFGSSLLARCAILTVGVDTTWRKIPTEQFPGPAKWLFFHASMVTEGFIHWAKARDVLSMNVETEVITHTTAPLLPQDYRGMSCYYYYLSAGKYLSLISREDKFLFEIWEMKPDSGEQRKLVNKIDLKCRLTEFSPDFIMPVGWVKYPDCLAFFSNGRGTSWIIYNLVTDDINCFRACGFDGDHRLQTVAAHRNSLVWFN